MTAKVIALASLVSALALFVFGLIRPNDPYFFVVSSDNVVALSRIFVAALAVNIAYQKRFHYKQSHILCASTAAFLALLGIIGFVYLPADYAWGNVIKPLDYIFALQCSLVLAVAASSYRRGTRHMPRVTRPRRTQLELFARRALS